MSNRYFFRCVLTAVSLVFGACGSKSSPSQVHKRPAAPGTAVLAVPPAASVPNAESTITGVPAVRPSAEPEAETLPGLVRKTFATAGSARSESSPFPHRVVLDKAGRVLGYGAFSDSAGVTARGYAGMVPVLVFFGAGGKPLRIYVLDNCESPAYLDLVYRDGLLERLLAYDPVKSDSVDAVTLATNSSHAIIAGVTGLATRVSAEIVAKRQEPH